VGELRDLFVQVLLLAKEMGVLKVGNISLDGSKIHADAFKSKAVSYKRLLALEERLRAEVAEVLSLGESADQGEVDLPEGLDNLARAKAVLQARAEERHAGEQAEYEAKVREREEKAKRKGRRPGGKPPHPPTPGVRDQDQYNFTDPDSRIMKNSTDDGFNQHYNAQVGVAQDRLLILGHSLSNHANDQAESTLASIPEQLGKIEAVAMDNGFFSPTNTKACEVRGIEPYIATGRQAHHQSWQSFFAKEPQPPSEAASSTVKMAYKLQTAVGHEIYRLRKCTVEPVIGLIKEVLGFRQFSLRGLFAAEWTLVCLAYNLKRLHVLDEKTA